MSLNDPYLQDVRATAKSDGTVAFATIDGSPIFGVNSNALGYTVADETASRPVVLCAELFGHRDQIEGVVQRHPRLA